jgi:hypothetical protein
MRGLVLASVAGLVLCAGCYGSTLPATDVGATSATLHARGTANSGPATSWFDYRPVRTGFSRSTSQRDWPAGASGSLSERVEGLLPATEYQFRLCGRDSAASSEVCAQYERFGTTKPAGDGIEAFVYPNPPPPRAVLLRISAHSDAAGGQPGGYVEITGTFKGYVTCLKVAGGRAAVVSVGQDDRQGDPGAEYIWYTLDPTKGIIDSAEGDGSGPDCRALPVTGDPRLPTPGPYEIAIWDSP